MSFTGFGDDFFGFFHELKNNNNRDWFNENKERYKQVVVEPVTAFITDIAPRLHNITPHYKADPRPNGGSMFRIYRDARFAKGEPYKTHAGIQFRHKLGKDAHAPGYYFHLEEGNIKYGAGVWTPPTAILTQIRERVQYYGDKWQAVLDDDAFKKHYGQILGDGLKRAPRGFSEDLEHIVDIKRKSYFLMKPIDTMALVGSRDFLDEVTEGMEAATPFMQFISDALDIEF